MSTDVTLPERLKTVGADGFVSAEEVTFLRRCVFKDGVVSLSELDTLFDLAYRAPDGDPEWMQFFAEAVADFYLREETPQGYLTDEEFDRLKSQVLHDGQVSRLNIGLLIKLMETAVSTPASMSRFVGEQIKQAIATKLGGAVVDTDDAALLRRYLFAVGGDGNVAVTRAEAELLLDINDATQSAPNSPAWSELFVLGLINHLMAHLGYSAPSRKEAFRSDAWTRDQSTNIGGFFKRMISGGASAIVDAYGSKNAHKERNAMRDEAAAQAAKITVDEADWLAARIGKDGGFDPNERRLIERMRELEGELPESLKMLLNRAA